MWKTGAVEWCAPRGLARPGKPRPDLVAAGVLITVGYWLFIPFLLCVAGVAPRASHMLGEYSTARHVRRLVVSFLDIDCVRLERGL